MFENAPVCINSCTIENSERNQERQKAAHLRQRAQAARTKNTHGEGANEAEKKPGEVTGEMGEGGPGSGELGAQRAALPERRREKLPR